MMGTEMTIAQELGAKITQFEAALAGTGVSPKRFVRVVMTALNINPDLLHCERRSLINASLRAAGDGLVPDGLDGALVAFDNKVTWMPMIGGIRKKVRRSGEVAVWDVTAVFAKDKFDYELGDDPFIKHKPYMAPELPRADGETDADYNARLRRHLDHGPMTHVYSVAMIRGGDKSRDVMTRAEVELVRDTYARKNKRGEFSAAWRNSFAEMAKKTIARRHAKSLPMSTDVQNLLSRDDELYDLDRDRGERVQAPRELNARLDFLAQGVDPDTGEFAESVDGVSTPPSQSAASDDGSGVGTRTEEAAHPSQSGAPAPDSADAGPPPVVAQPEPEGASGPSTPPGAIQPPQRAPGGPSQTDLLTLRDSLEQRGADMAQKGRMSLERWVTDLPADDMAKISLAQLKAWRTTADKVGVDR